MGILDNMKKFFGKAAEVAEETVEKASTEAGKLAEKAQEAAGEAMKNSEGLLSEIKVEGAEYFEQA